MRATFNFNEGFLTCRNCGYRNHLDALFCMFCGKNLLEVSLPRVLKEAQSILQKMDCKLCNLVKTKESFKIYLENDTFILTDCIECGLPVVILKEHKSELGDKDSIILNRLLDILCENCSFSVNTIQNEFADHWYCHIEIGGEKWL